MKQNKAQKLWIPTLVVLWLIVPLLLHEDVRAQERCPDVQPTRANTDTEHNMAVIRCYFGQILDNKKITLADQVLAPDCTMHRPGVSIVGIEDINKFLSVVPLTFAEFKTTFLDMFATGDRVAVRLRHDLRYAEDGISPFRTGKYSIGGMKLTWTANAIFRFKEGKVAEEWVEGRAWTDAIPGHPEFETTGEAP